MKEFLSQKGVDYKELDVAHDPAAAAEMVRVSNQRGVPVTVINGTVVVGFDRRRLEQLLGQAERPRLGAAVADAASMPDKVTGGVREGAYIGQVRAGSLAAQAGLHTGDIITMVGGHTIRSAFDLEYVLERLAVGQMVAIRFLRANQEQETRIRFQ